MTGGEYCDLLKRSPDEAREKLFNEYYAYVKTIAFNRLRSVGTLEDVEECISDVFAETFFGFDDGKNYADMKAYIGIIAKRTSIDRYRSLSRKAGRSVSLDEEGFPETRSDEDLVAEGEKTELRRILMECIKALGEPDSTILVQKFYYDKNSRQIGKLLSMKPAAVRMRCKRAAEKLREELASRGVKEESL